MGRKRTGNQTGADGQGGDDDGQDDDQNDLGLLDDDFDDDQQDDDQDDDTDDGDDDENDDDQGGDGQPQGLTQAAVTQMIESALDRRINAVLKDRRDGGTGRQQQQRQTGAPGAGQQQQRQPTGPTASDVREARSVYRDYVGDEIKFLDNAERDLAGDLAAAKIRERLGRGEDPETAGSAVAKEVAAQVKSLRKTYEKTTVARLRSRGQIATADQSRPGQTKPGGKEMGMAGYQGGAAAAQRLLPGRFPQQQQSQ